MMEYEFLIESKADGQIYDVSQLVESVRYRTFIREQAGKFEFDLLKDDVISYSEGDKVRFQVKPDGEPDFVPIFFGYVFSKEKNRWGLIKTTCYDQLRYLKAHESYVFTGVTATQVIKKIADDFQLKVGTLADTGYTITSTIVQQNKALLDIIYYGLQQTQLNTGKLYNFYDDFGSLTLTEAKDMYVDVILGVESLVTDYNYKTDIDADTYNKIKLVKPNRKTGKGDVYIAQDTNTQKNWGILQKYDVVDENLNDAQIQEKAKNSLAYYNRALKTLKLENCLGVPGLRAGHMVTVDIPDIDDLSSSKRLLLDSVEHTFSSSKHTMNCGMRVFA